VCAVLLAAAAAMLGPATLAAEPVHGVAMHGLPKHLAGFSHFPYVNPDAPKGGRLVLGQLGTFDSLNPFIIKGVSAYGLRDYVFESLMMRSGDEPFTLYGLIAETIELPPDRSFITFHLRSEARFADGQPITPRDVLFSHQVLKEKAGPITARTTARWPRPSRSASAACASPSRRPATARPRCCSV
jgi:peptide/nickel transport system substrate-binding protein